MKMKKKNAELRVNCSSDDDDNTKMLFNSKTRANQETNKNNQIKCKPKETKISNLISFSYFIGEAGDFVAWQGRHIALVSCLYEFYLVFLLFSFSRFFCWSYLLFSMFIYVLIFVALFSFSFNWDIQKKCVNNGNHKQMVFIVFNFITSIDHF